MEVDPGKSPFKAALAAYLIRQHVEKLIASTPDLDLPPKVVPAGDMPTTDADFKCRDPECEKNKVPLKDLKIGIIGAGISGLYLAYHLVKNGVPCEVLEANPDRIGGRLYTHYFSGDDTDPSKHDYYDIGAMRFPDSPVMTRTFELFKLLNLERGDYVMKCNEEPMRYNDITDWPYKLKAEDKKDFDPFRVSTINGGNVPPETVRDPDVIMNDAMDRFRNKIMRAMENRAKRPAELDQAWSYLMRHDKYSFRDYLNNVEGQDFETIHWLETTQSATNWFDQAFTENVLESLAFDYGETQEEKDKIKWYFVYGGGSHIARTFYNLIKKTAEEHNLPDPIEMGKRVTSIGVDRKLEGHHKMRVQVTGESEPRFYSTVINTTTLAALQKMDLTQLQLPYATKTAIRSLRYDPSTKIAIKFKYNWWINKFGIKGGLGKTDIPLRTCVYPSYNIKDYEALKTDDERRNTPAVLLCSYSWGQDSERLAAMVNYPSEKKDKPKTDEQRRNDEELKEVMLKNLARLHTKTEKEYEDLYKEISAAYLEHHGYDWSKDPYTCGGAFALYGPGQFSKLYPHLALPCSDSRFHIVGEAASAHHAWVAGALDSAARALYLTYERFHQHDQQAEMRKEAPWEMDLATAYEQVELGKLIPGEKKSVAVSTDKT